MFILAFFIMAGLWYYTRKGESSNIRHYIESKGGELLSEEYEPFGKGWFGERNETIFKITYRDKISNVHKAWAKTSFFTGVFLSDDTIIHYANRKDKDKKLNDLEDENTQLKTELAQLKKQKELEEEFKIVPGTTEEKPQEKSQVKIEQIHTTEQNSTKTTRIHTVNTDDGEFIIEKSGIDLNVGDKVFLNKKMAPNGRYKLGFLQYIYVKDGIC